MVFCPAFLYDHIPSCKCSAHAAPLLPEPHTLLSYCLANSSSFNWCPKLIMRAHNTQTLPSAGLGTQTLSMSFSGCKEIPVLLDKEKKHQVYRTGGKNAFGVALFFFHNIWLIFFQPCLHLLVMAQAVGQQLGLGTRADVVPEGCDKNMLSNPHLGYFYCSFRQETSKCLKTSSQGN